MGPILEREPQLAQLDELLGNLKLGAGGTIVIEGQPGLGKSRLIAEARTRIGRQAQIELLTFCCGELEQELAWAGVVGLLSPAVEALSAKERAEVFAGPAAPAALVFEAPAQAAADGELNAHGAVHALYRVLTNLARRTPILILYDDAHWSDRESLAFFLYLQRRLAGLRVGLVVATRPPDTVAASDLLERLAAGPTTEVQQLAGLQAASVTELVRAQGFPDADEKFCRSCWEVTAGNPFFLHELLLALDEDQAQELTGPDLVDVPSRTILRSVLIRLGRIQVPHAVALAQAVAVLGDGTTLRHAAALAGVSLEAAAPTLDALSRAELLADGEPLRFVHPLVRRAIYSDIPAGRRAREHARAAELLADDEDLPDRIALHLLHAPLAASAQTTAALIQAAARARRRGAPQAAVRFLRRALEEPPPTEQRLPVLVDLAEAETAVGDPAATQHLTLALERVGDDAYRSELLLKLGWSEHQAGRFGDAADAFQRGLAGLEPSDELAAHLEAGYLMSAVLDSTRAAGALERLAVIEASPAQWRGLSERALLAQVLYLRTISGAPAGGIIQLAERLWDDGRLLAEAGPDWGSLWHLIGALSWADAYPQALSAIGLVLAAADARGSALPRAWGGYARSWPRFWTAQIDEAAADARMAVEIWAGGMETYLPAALYWLGRCELERGDLAAAERALALAGPDGRWEGTGMLGFVLGLRGHIEAHVGRSENAAAMHLACGEVVGKLMVTNPSVMAWRSEAALSLRLLGETRRALALVEEELELARACGAPRAIGCALRALGVCADGATGAARLAESVTVLADSGATFEHARSLTELGAAVRRQGRRRDARGHLERARELLDGSGASALLRRVETELGAAGGRSQRSLQTGVAALTASERRVADLAAQGHTNRYIAALLQISVKAVEWHLHQCYRKLEISGRRELPGELGG